MKWDEQRNLLLAKAADDEKAMLVLAAEATTSDAMVGFHAQQAVEKYLKALLCHIHVNFARTHDLLTLLDTLSDHGCPVPPEVEACKYLQPYAVHFRYDDVPVGGAAALDRSATARHVKLVREWVQRGIAERNPPA